MANLGYGKRQRKCVLLFSYYGLTPSLGGVSENQYLPSFFGSSTQHGVPYVAIICVAIVTFGVCSDHFVAACCSSFNCAQP